MDNTSIIVYNILKIKLLSLSNSLSIILYIKLNIIDYIYTIEETYIEFI